MVETRNETAGGTHLETVGAAATASPPPATPPAAEADPQPATELPRLNRALRARLDTLLAAMNPFSRIVVCGLISEYNATQPYAYKRLRSVLVNRIRMQGMIVFDWKERYGEALQALAEHLAAGRLKYRESVVEGLDNAPQGLIALLKGQNFGKQLVKLA